MADVLLEVSPATSLKRRTYSVLEETGTVSRVAFAVRFGIIFLILLNTVAVVLESVESFRASMSQYFGLLEWASVAVFSIEYIARLWSITESTQYRHPFFGRLRYAVTPLALIDLIAVLPAYLSVGIASQLLTLRTLRLVRVFRLFKLAHYSVAMRSLGAALSSKLREMIVVLFFLAILLVIASSLIYHVENEVQPDRFGSIPDAMWWGVATMTTVGYGDVYPVTPLGKLLGSLVAVLGAGLFPMPAAIWGAAFIERALRQEKASVCPHCGHTIDASRVK